MDLNVVTFSGRLGQDPKMRYTPQGVAVVNFRFAVGLAKEKTLWFDVTAWRKLAENVNQYLSKGSHVAVTGRLDQDEWLTKNDERRTTLVIHANDVRFLGGPSKEGAGSKDETESDEALIDRNLEPQTDSDSSSFDDDFPI